MAGTWECGVCWQVYDPAQGDDVQQIPPGTPFEELPADWRCPRCDGPRERYLRRETQESLQQRLMDAYAAADTRLRGLPVHHAVLRVEVLPPVRTPAGDLTAVVTPWCLNAVLVPSGDAVPPGVQVERMVPAGGVMFTGSHLDGVGAFEVCSLESHMQRFADHASAVETAREALRLLCNPPAQTVDSGKEAPPSTSSRRALLGLGSGAV